MQKGVQNGCARVTRVCNEGVHESRGCARVKRVCTRVCKRVCKIRVCTSHEGVQNGCARVTRVCTRVCKITEGGHWAKAKTCSFLHEKCNLSYVTSSNWTQSSFKLMLTLTHNISYPSTCSDLDKSPCVQNDRTKHTSCTCTLYPIWVLSRGNDTLICISCQPLALFAPLLLQ